MSRLRLIPTLLLTAAIALALSWWNPRAPQPGIESADSIEFSELPEAAQIHGTSLDPEGASASPADVVAADAEILKTDVTGITKLSGWVGDTDGAGLAGIEIQVQSQGFDGEAIEVLTGRSDARGDFIVEGLVAGRAYRLDIAASRTHAGYSLDSISVDADSAPRRISLQAIELANIDGMIVDIEQAPVADFELSLRSLAVEFPERVIRSDASGFFRIEDFPVGELRISSSGADYYRIKGIELKRDEYRSLILAVDRGSYHLSGWVSDAGGLPLEKVRVTLKSAFATNEYHSFAYRSRLTDSNGAFAFADLGGQRYTVAVYAKGYDTHIQHHEFQSFSDTLEIRLSN